MVHTLLSSCYNRCSLLQLAEALLPSYPLISLCTHHITDD